ncbi:MAG: DUF1616 domain-containing protein [Fervidobacterium sp.]
MSKKFNKNELCQTIIKIVDERKPQTVKELIVLVKEQLQIPDQEIVDSILQLQSEGKISLVKRPQAVPQNLLAYLKTEQTRWYWATVVTAIVTATVVFTIAEDLFPLVYARYILGAIFVLWLPGYTFIRALFPTKSLTKKSENNLDIVERIALSLGMSLALVPIIGLLLNYTPWGIRLTPIVLSLLALTLVFATIALIREHQASVKAND